LSSPLKWLNQLESSLEIVENVSPSSVTLVDEEGIVLIKNKVCGWV
jgi:hypothetical protein